MDAATVFSFGYAMEKTVKLVAHYWACVLFCRRWLVCQSPAEMIHNHAVAYIVSCLYDQYAQEKRRLVRFAWPMFMATIETRNPIHRTWLLERLHEIRNASAECQWNWKVATEIVELQSVPGQPLVDLAQFIQLEVATEPLQSTVDGFP
jgi:hypothetical protein